MKKLIALIPVLALLLALCACSDPAGDTPSEGASQKPTASQPVSGGPDQNTADPGETPSAADPKTIALELSERRAPVSELYAAIGQPISSDYAPGCVEPDSDDGELHYDGFTVYTVRTATREYVYDVLGDDEL